MHFSPLLLLSLVGLASGQDTSLSAVKRAFKVANIPDDLSITFHPRFLLEVTFPQPTGLPITLHAGIQLPRNSTAGPPSFAVVGNAGAGPFLVAAVDPDAPTPQAPTSAQIRHLLAPNFSAGNPHANVHPLVNSTVAISPFRQPNPPAGSDAHRQPPGFNSQTLVTPTTPVQLFNISSFAAATGLGAPIAGTFMLVAPNPPAA